MHNINDLNFLRNKQNKREGKLTRKNPKVLN